ncbi:MAG: hypothetical protein IBX63_10275 [Coriobacteriia bacterium]|nr:hypothetical protein [Coriobacteriia bacterium]
MKRGWLILGLAVVFVAAVAGLAFAFGTPQAPPSPAAVSPPPPAVAGGGVVPQPDSGPPVGQGAPFGGEIVEGEVPAPDPESPFTFQIPGCRCHSDDPAVVEEHANYRLNQCRGCHAGSP